MGRSGSVSILTMLRGRATDEGTGGGLAADGIGGGTVCALTTPVPLNGVAAEAGRPEPGGRDGPVDTAVKVIRSVGETCAAAPVYLGSRDGQPLGIACLLRGTLRLPDGGSRRHAARHRPVQSDPGDRLLRFDHRADVPEG